MARAGWGGPRLLITILLAVTMLLALMVVMLLASLPQRMMCRRLPLLAAAPALRCLLIMISPILVAYIPVMLMAPSIGSRRWRTLMPAILPLQSSVLLAGIFPAAPRSAVALPRGAPGPTATPTLMELMRRVTALALVLFALLVELRLAVAGLRRLLLPLLLPAQGPSLVLVLTMAVAILRRALTCPPTRRSPLRARN